MHLSRPGPHRIWNCVIKKRHFRPLEQAHGARHRTPFQMPQGRLAGRWAAGLARDPSRPRRASRGSIYVVGYRLDIELTTSSEQHRSGQFFSFSGCACHLPSRTPPPEPDRTRVVAPGQKKHRTSPPEWSFVSPFTSQRRGRDKELADPAKQSRRPPQPQR